MTRGAAGLQDGRQAAARAAGAQHEVQHGGGLAEHGAVQKAHGVGEIGMVEQVVGFQMRSCRRCRSVSRNSRRRPEIDLRHAETG